MSDEPDSSGSNDLRTSSHFFAAARQYGPPVLYEESVVAAVCDDLQRSGWTIDQRLTTTQQGVDIIATLDAQVLHVEAKGETSGKNHTARYGKPFDAKQIRSHVARALYAAATAVSNGSMAALALPHTPGHRAAVAKIAPALTRLDVYVAWVDGERGVTWEPSLPR